MNRLSTDRKFFKQVVERKPLRGLIETVKDASIKTENNFNAQELKQNLSKTIDALFKPEQIPEQIDPKLLMKKKERKKQQKLFF
ncbi:MAG: hypothetical protein ABJB05_08530 [Parafilimonas sp.]